MVSYGMGWGTMKLSKKIPRPSLNWLSIQDITDARNKLIGLYLAPGECVFATEPEQIEISLNGTFPRFRYTHSGTQLIGWLKIPKKGKPYWDVEALGVLQVAVPFNSPLMAPVVKLIKAWKKEFPYKTTENYLIRNGECIA